MTFLLSKLHVRPRVLRVGEMLKFSIILRQVLRKRLACPLWLRSRCLRYIFSIADKLVIGQYKQLNYWGLTRVTLMLFWAEKGLVIIGPVSPVYNIGGYGHGGVVSDIGFFFRRFIKEGFGARVYSVIFWCLRFFRMLETPLRSFVGVLRKLAPSLKTVDKYVGKRKFMLPTAYMTFRYQLLKVVGWVLIGAEKRGETVFFVRIFNEILDAVLGMGVVAREKRRWDKRALKDRSYLRFFKRPLRTKRRFKKLTLLWKR